MAKITKIKASDTPREKAPKEQAPKEKPAKAKPAKEAPAKAAKAPKKSKKTKEANYFKGAWQEIRQVRWPSRKATWKMFLAVILYSAIFIVVIMLLDVFFQWLFSLFLV